MAWDLAARSPRSRAAGADAEVHKALEREGLKLQDLVALRTHPEAALARLRLSGAAAVAFERLAATAQARAEGADEERFCRQLDVVNGEGHLILQRPRADVHREGLWHRAVDVWVVCPKTCRVLLGQRASHKDHDPDGWTCASGRVLSGERSMNTAVERLVAEFSIRAVADKNISLVFRTRCSRRFERGIFAGQVDGTLVDVYVARLPQEVPIERMKLDIGAKQAAKYMALADLRQAWDSGDTACVALPSKEYSAKLLHHLQKACVEDGGAARGKDGSPPLIVPKLPYLGVTCAAWGGH